MSAEQKQQLETICEHEEYTELWSGFVTGAIYSPKMFKTV
jgi:hypothetical protein